MRPSRLVRLAKYRRAVGQLRRKARRAAKGGTPRSGAGDARPAAPRASPSAALGPSHAAGRTFLSRLITALLTVIETVRSGLSWARGLLSPMPARAAPLLPPDEFLVVGHRGAPASAPENTLASFDRALADGANAIETDFCVTKDDQVVVWHDWDPDELVAFARAAGAEFDVAYRPVSPPEGDPMRRPVRELTLAELRAHYGLATMKGVATTPVHLPVLDEVVAWAAAQGDRLKCVLVDIKIPAAHKACAKTLLDALEAAIARHRPACRFLLMTPVLPVLQALRDLAPGRSRTFDVEIKPGFSPDADDVDPRFAPYSAVRWAVRQGNDHASIGRPRFTLGGWPLYRNTVRRDLGELTLKARHPQHDTPVRLLCWTLNRPRERRWLLRLGVHGILTDFPADLRREYEAEWAREVRKAAERGAAPTPPPPAAP